MPTLELEGIDMRFGAVHAVRGASLDVAGGAVHAVVGENGAGKSTLLKIAAGILEPDAGEVRVDGARLAPHTAAEAIRRGVGIVQQHFALIGVFTGLENLVLGAEPVTGRLGRLDLGRARAAALSVAKELGVELALDRRVETLGVGDRQRLEIARVLLRDARIIILDEPTAVLTPGEVHALYATLRRLADAGRAIVVVTHKLDEVQDHADRVTVLRRGETVHRGRVARGAPRDFELASLARAIMGGDPPPPVKRAHDLPAATAGVAGADDAARRSTGSGPARGARLVVRDVALGRALHGVSFEVRAGEIVGIAGILGNGQRELVRVLAGLEAPSHGTFEAPRVSVVHEDRQLEGLALDAPVGDNLVLGELGRFARFGVIDDEALAAEASLRAARFEVHPPDLARPARALSGGNQQKIVVARAVARAGPRATLVVLYPTRGVDLGATRTIHARILEAARAGAAVLVVSADLAELRALVDRILVLARGSIVAELPPTASDADIGAKMVGAAGASP